MKAFIAIDHTIPDHHKHMEFDTRAEAEAHILANLPSGFVAESPAKDGAAYWIVDPVAKTVVHDAATSDADKTLELWKRLRIERNALLVDSDWTQASDSPLTDEVKATWATYREELRDFPESADPDDPTWPTPPE